MRERAKTKKKKLSRNREWCSKHTLSRDSGQITSGLVGKLGEMPTKNQKWLVKL